MSFQKWSIAIIIVLSSLSAAKAQTQMGTWSNHLSYNNCIAISSNDQWIYGLSTSGIIKYNQETFEISKISKINMLSDVNLSAFLPLDNNDNYIVGYANGNIDVYDNKIFNMPEIKEKDITGSKNINRFRQFDNYTLAVTNFGVVVISADKKEIKDTWYFGVDNSNVQCNDVTVYNDSIYVATEIGLFVAPKNSKFLSYFGTWRNLSPNKTPFKAAQTINNKLITVRLTNNSFFASATTKDGTTDFAQYNSFKNLYINNSNIYITAADVIQRFSESLTLLGEKRNYVIAENQTLAPNFTGICTSNNSSTNWISDSYYGFIKNNLNGFDELTTPSGPISNSVQDLSHNGTYLVTVPGIKMDLNKGDYPALINFYENDKWSTLTGQENSFLTGKTDLFNLYQHPRNTDKFYISSWANGVFELNNKTVTQRYDHTNTPLKTIVPNNYNYIRVGGAVIDKNDVLYMNNSYVNYGIVAVKGSDTIAYNYKPLEVGNAGDMLIDNNGYFWMFVRRSTQIGLFVFDVNKTPFNQDDDRYRGVLTKEQDNNKRNFGPIYLIDQDGEEVTNSIHSLAMDKNGDIWVGTDKGPLVNNKTYAVFTEEVPIFNRIKIPQIQDPSLADYLLESEIITCIAIDGANRKWLGTASSGAFLVSEDGTKTIQHFSFDNSPILSNYIFSIAIDPISGIVYFGTDQGIVSYKGTATSGKKDQSSLYAYPNPVRPGYVGPITIKGFVENSEVKITTITGDLVYQTTSLGGQIVWDGRNMWGEEVKSGIYIVYGADTETGEQAGFTKITIVR